MTAHIPKRALPSTCMVRVPKDGGGEYDEPVAIKHVRFEPKDAIRATDYQLRDTVTGVLIIDSANSDGAFGIPAGSLVSIDGGPESCVSGCTEYSTWSGVHHWEIELS